MFRNKCFISICIIFAGIIFCGIVLSSFVISSKITDITLKLKTSCDEEIFDLTDLEKIVTSKNFDGSKKLVIYFSGWLIGLSGTGLEDVAKAYNCRNDTNFVSAHSANFLKTIFQWSVFNVPVIAGIFGEGLARVIEQNMYPLDRIHIIGHSLGAHIAGQTGRYFKEKTGKSIKRITGLDPGNGCSNEGCIQHNDADFVDIIHTNPGFFATKDVLGDVDFYVGGLSSLQNGCKLLGCSHIRACKYYAETIYPNNANNFLAAPCPNINEVNVNSCQGKSVPMGYGVPFDSKGIYYLEVNSKEPFGKNALNIKDVVSTVNECNLCIT